MYLFKTALWKEILELGGKGSAQQKMPAQLSKQQLCLCVTGCSVGRTDWDGWNSGQSGNAQTDGPFLDSSSGNSLWEEEGAMLSAPKSAHSWRRRDAFTMS